MASKQVVSFYYPSYGGIRMIVDTGTSKGSACLNPSNKIWYHDGSRLGDAWESNKCFASGDCYVNSSTAKTPSEVVGSTCYIYGSSESYRQGTVKTTTAYTKAKHTITISPSAGGTVIDSYTPDSSGYSLTFTYGGETYYNDADVENGTVSLFATPKSNYTFLYWEDGSTNRWKSAKAFSSQSYTAYFAANFTVKFNANGGSGTMSNQSCMNVSTSSITSNSFTRTDYAFNGWNTKSDGSGTSVSDAAAWSTVFSDCSLSAGGTVTLYAQWRVAKSFVVHYNSNGGSGTISDTTVTAGNTEPVKTQSFTAPSNKKKKSTTFAWNTQSDGSGTYYADGATIDNTSGAGGEVTLFAQWVNWATLTVTYKANGGTGSDQTQSIAPSDTTAYGYAKAANTFSRTGHSFAKWNTENDGSGTDYAAGAVIYNSGNAGGTLTLYAIWTPYKTIVTFNANGGTGVAQTQTFNYGTAQNLTDVSTLGFSRQYYTFLGWSENSLATSATYSNKQSVTFNPSSPAEYKNFYAVWSHDTCTITFNANGGSGTMSNQTVYKGEAKALTSNAFTRTNHTFAGWATSSNGSVVYADGASITCTSNTTLFARWYTPLTVSYNTNNSGKKSKSSDVVLPGNTLTLSDLDSSYWPDAKKFDYWSYNGSAYTSVYNSPTIDTQSGFTMVAQYKDWASITINYWSNGSVKQTQVIDPGSSGQIVRINDITGYHLPSGNYVYSESSGSSTASSTYYVGKTISNSGTAQTINLYAIWYANTYTVTYDRQGGSDGTSSATATYNSYLSSITIPSRSGYDFGGYYTGTNGSGTQFINPSGQGVNKWTFTESKTLYAKWTKRKYSVRISKSSSNINCTLRAKGDDVDTSTTDATLSFSGVENCNYVITVTFSSTFLARKYVPTTIGSVSFTKSGDYSYTATINVGTSAKTLTITFTETALYTITTASEFNAHIPSPVTAPTISISPTADDATTTPNKWFAQTVRATQSGADSRATLSGWAARDASTGTTDVTSTDDTFSFSLTKNTIVVAIYAPKELVSTEVTCALHSASAAVGSSPSCEISNCYITNKIHIGDTATFTANVVSGYTFKDWVDGSGNVVSTERVYSCVLSGEIHLYARYGVDVSVYLVTGDGATGTVTLNGESSSSTSVPVTLNLTLGSTATIGCTTENVFDGWYTDSFLAEQSLTEYDQTDSFVVSSGKILYASVVSAASSKYVAFYTYNQTTGQEGYDASLGQWAVTGNGTTEISKSQYQTATGLTALSDGRFFEIVGVKRLSVALTKNIQSEYGFSNVKKYKAANTPGTVLETYASMTFSFVANQNLIIRGNFGTLVPVTVTALCVTGCSTYGTPLVNGASTAQVVQDETCNLSALPKNGYKFDGWYSEAAGTTLLSSSPNYSPVIEQAVTFYAKFARDRNAICEWEGSQVNKTMRWKSKTFVSSRPFAPQSFRIDALGYVPNNALKLTVGLFSSPDGDPTATVDITNITSQGMRRIPKMRNEKYMRLTVENDAEIDAIVTGTSSVGVVT